MKIDRRSFLAFGVGGAAGTALSPLPWKLADDSAIWSQMWHWVPVPPDGKVETKHSTCMLCPGGCGITVRKIDNRPIKIEGREGHPISQGGLCPLGAAGLQYLYGPSRIKTPLKRVGNRGEGHFKPVSWEAGLTELAEKLGVLRAEGRPQGAVWMSGNGRGTVVELIKRFLTAYGSPNFIGPATAQTAVEAAATLMSGKNGRVAFDVENADFILSFGSDLLDGWGSPVQMFRAFGSREERQTKIVQIDYRLSNTAAKADQFIAVNPGTEGALAFGVVHQIITENGFNPTYVSQFANGFDALKQKVTADFTPDKVAGITGVSTEMIAEMAKKFAAAKRPLAVCGRGQGAVAGALNDTVAVMALNALVGNINAEGGIHLLPDQGYITWPDPEMDEIAEKGVATPRADGIAQADNGSPYLPHRLFSGQAPAVELLLLSDANPLYTLKDTTSVLASMEKIPYIASFSSFMDESAQQADLILPNHIYLERYEDVPAPSGTTKPYVGLAQPVLPPEYDTRYLGDVIIDLAGRLNGTIAGSFEWENYEACLKATLGWKWNGMEKDGFWTDNHYVTSGWGTIAGTTPGRLELRPVQSDTIWEKVEPEGDSGGFPLLLVPYDSIRLARGDLGNPPFVTKTVSETVLIENDLLVEINPATADEIGLKEGAKGVITTPKGEAKVRIHRFNGIKPGIIAMPTGLGHTAFDEYLAGKGVNINRLMATVEDPATGFDAAWGIRAKLSKA